MPPSSVATEDPSVIRVLVADDHAVVCDSLRLLLSKEPDLDVVATAVDGAHAVALAIRQRPDVVVMDLSMPTLSGVEATRQLKHASPDTRVLVLSGQGRGAVIRAAYAAGVSGYLSKNVRAADLLDAIRRTHAGESVFSAGTARPMPRA